MSKIFVTGVSGFAGGYICKELLGRGHEVFGLVRNQKSNLKLEIPALNILRGDLSDPVLITKYLVENNISYVIHVAAVVADWGPWHIFYETNVVGTENLLDACKKNETRFFIYVSTVDVMHYHHKSDQMLTELTPYSESKHFYQRTKTMAELKVLLAASFMKVVSVRPAWIFGPGDRTTFPEIIKALNDGFLPLPGKKNTKIPLIYVKNLACFISDLVEQADTLPNNLKLNVADDVNITWRDLVECLRIKFYPKAIVVNLPYVVLYFVAIFLESFYKLFRIKVRPILTTASLPMLASSITIDIALMNKYLKSNLVDFDTALDETIAWFQSNSTFRKRLK